MDFKLTSVTKSLQGIKHHILKFHSARTIDPLEDFTPPVLLHRKDLMAGPETQDSLSETGSKNASQEAAGNSAGQNMKLNAFKRKTRQVYAINEAEWKLKQEERIPWVLEDFDGRNTWIGTMEGGQSHNYVFFVFAENGFKVVPASKCYRFNQKNRYQTLSIDEAEAKMNKRVHIPRWFMKKEAKENNTDGCNSVPLYRLKTVTSQGKYELNGDHDGDEELDFNEEFADDEETPFIEGNEEDNKELEERIKREIRSASSLGDVDKFVNENIYSEKRRMNKEGRKIRKYLTSHEKNHIYETDEDDNPYASEEDIDSDISNFQREDEIKQEKIMKDKKKQPQNTPLQGDSNINKDMSPLSKALSTEVSNNLSADFTKHLALSNTLKTQKQDYLRSIRSIRPYLITLKLPKHHLITYANSFEQFTPILSSLSRETSPEPNKRRKLDTDINSSGESSNPNSNDPKKTKIRITNNSQNHNLNVLPTLDQKTDTSNTVDIISSDSHLVTEEELRNAIHSRKMNAKELLKSFKPKLGMNPKNRDLILELVTRIAKMENGYLVLKN
ncbi:transcription factor IIF subunit TFG1 [Pneumocystis jirovecii RU7]|uniref:Transcription initiation factor IIF subunit alpha n=1 Tax=Pneumocystis jirovecii (strain RU7) TaxID=1408657 RepID=A0A0W4ZNQ2_PNEJ7|nr:transcription factor IIF subunit TFG1 [Pneumocystis jirovecii RU7]KTW29974.1 hypothetical protein T551_01918 [Pneumocystis jirovecii RU7]